MDRGITYEKALERLQLEKDEDEEGESKSGFYYCNSGLSTYYVLVRRSSTWPGLACWPCWRPAHATTRACIFGAGGT